MRKTQPRALQKGKRYRLVFDNQTDDPHPVHLHRNSFELTNVYGKPTAGVMKDVVLVKGFRKIAVDFAPAMEGLTLFHCHQQFHMDYGFKMLFNVNNRESAGNARAASRIPRSTQRSIFARFQNTASSVSPAFPTGK